jgi:hypothetical protein
VGKTVQYQKAPDFCSSRYRRQGPLARRRAALTIFEKPDHLANWPLSIRGPVERVYVRFDLDGQGGRARQQTPLSDLTTGRASCHRSDFRFSLQRRHSSQRSHVREGPRGDIRPLQQPQTCVENVGTFLCENLSEIQLGKMLNQQLGKGSDLSRGVMPRWSHNKDSSFRERVAIH